MAACSDGQIRGATGLAAAGRRRYCTLYARQGACVQVRDAFWKLSMRSGSSAFHPDAKDMLASSLAREILAASSERAKLSAELGRLLQDDKTYRCLLTIPGISPRAPLPSPPRSTPRSSLETASSPHTAISYPQTTTADPPSGRRGTPIKATRRSRQ